MISFKERVKKFDWDLVVVPVCLVLGLLVLWFFTGQWPNKTNAFNSFALQANSWVQGHLNLIHGEYYTNLELAIFNNQYFVSFPPFPSYILLPFVWILKTVNTPDHWLAVFSYLVAGVYAVKLFKVIRTESDGAACFFPIFLLMASNVVYTSMNGWVWFIAQNFAFTLSLVAIYYAVQKKGGLSLALWACAVGCRPMQILYLPVLLLILYRQIKKEDSQTTLLSTIKHKWYWVIPTGIIGLSYMILNFLRFGNITEFGHNYLPEFTRTTTGQFDLSYLAANWAKLFRLPEQIAETGRMNFYYFDGFCVFLVSPILIAFIIALGIGIYRKTDNLLAILLPILMVVHILLILSHKTLGGSHFGNRYFNDLLPFVYYGLLVYMPKNRWFTKLCYPLCAFGMLLNYVGTIVCYNNWFQY